MPQDQYSTPSTWSYVYTMLSSGHSKINLKWSTNILLWKPLTYAWFPHTIIRYKLHIWNKYAEGILIVGAAHLQRMLCFYFYSILLKEKDLKGFFLSLFLHGIVYSIRYDRINLSDSSRCCFYQFGVMQKYDSVAYHKKINLSQRHTVCGLPRGPQGEDTAGNTVRQKRHVDKLWRSPPQTTRR